METIFSPILSRPQSTSSLSRNTHTTSVRQPRRQPGGPSRRHEDCSLRASPASSSSDNDHRPPPFTPDAEQSANRTSSGGERSAWLGGRDGQGARPPRRCPAVAPLTHLLGRGCGPGAQGGGRIPNGLKSDVIRQAEARGTVSAMLIRKLPPVTPLRCQQCLGQPDVMLGLRVPLPGLSPCLGHHLPP